METLQGKTVFESNHFHIKNTDYGFKIYFECPYCHKPKPCGEFSLDLESKKRQIQLFEKTFTDDLPTWKRVCEVCH